MVAPGLDAVWDDYLWIVVCGGLASFYMAWGIGANDVANSFATSVGSRTLKLWQACIIAAIFEFVGAIALGGETTKTVASDITNLEYFQDVPEIYMYGMLCSLAVAGTWLLIATYWCLAVSTTHSIIGAIMGFALVYGGWNGVLWHQETGTFPYTRGFLPVVLSWFFSPLVGGTLASIIFSLNRVFILRRANSTNLAIYSLPILLFITIFINLMFVLAKGAKAEMTRDYPCTTSIGRNNISFTDCTKMYNAAAWISAVAALGLAVVGGGIGIYFLKKKMQKDLNEAEAAANAESAEKAGGQHAIDGDIEGAATKEGVEHIMKTKPEDRVMVHEIPEDASWYRLPYHYGHYFYSITARQMIKGLYFEVHDHGLAGDAAVQAMHAGAEVFPVQTEKVYQYLQVFSACCVAFAHGANDVANSIGPFSGIYTAYMTHAVPTGAASTEKWIFAMGGLGIVLGLMMYGYNIIMQLGVKLLHLTPCRGFSAELAAGLTISLASFYGIPVSTTQIIVGCEIGIGLTENVRTGLNFPVLARTFMGWIWTILLALSFCAALFSAGGYAPSIVMANEMRYFRQSAFNTANTMYGQMQATNNLHKNETAWWNGTTVPINGTALDAKITNQMTSFKKALFIYSKNKYGAKNYMSSVQVSYYLQQALDLMANTSSTTIGVVPSTSG